MSDNLPPAPTPPAEAGTPNTVTNISGGVNINAQRDVNIGGDVVGRDKSTNSQPVRNLLDSSTVQDTPNRLIITSVDELLAQFQSYSHARVSFLAQLQQSRSCRDPLAEFSEVLVARLLGATRAPNRVQKGYDLTRPNGRHVQVKYLSNPGAGWINWHTVHFTELCEEYALVLFVRLRLQSVLVFPCETVSQVCQALKKHHPYQDRLLQFTEKNLSVIRADPARFEALGVEIFQFGEAAASQLSPDAGATRKE